MPYAGWLPLEQLKAAFYTEVTKTPYYNRASADKAILTGIRSHEIAHRDFFEAALKKNAIPALEVDFTKTDFNSRDSVLVSVFTFEDLAWRPITALDSCWRRANICFSPARSSLWKRATRDPLPDRNQGSANANAGNSGSTAGSNSSLVANSATVRWLAIASSATLTSNSAVNRLRVFMIDHPLRQ